MNDGAVSAVNALLAAAAGVTALVPAARIVSGPILLTGTAILPAVSVRAIDDTEYVDVRMTGRRLITERVQVTVYTASYIEKRPLLQAIRDACVGQRGNFGGVYVDGILPGGNGPDLDDPGDPIFERSCDLMVRWLTA